MTQPVRPYGLPERLRALREMAGLTRKELAKLSGLADSHVGLIESARRSAPSAETLAKIAKATGVPLGWLATGDGRAPTSRAVKAAIARATEARAS